VATRLSRVSLNLPVDEVNERSAAHGKTVHQFVLLFIGLMSACAYFQADGKKEKPTDAGASSEHGSARHFNPALGLCGTCLLWLSIA
jgi:hypothetical protein